jgi:ferredoxin
VGGSTDRTDIDLVDLPVLGRFLHWRHARAALALPMLFLAGLMVFDGLLGPQLAPKNLATVLVWVHYRGLVVLALLLVGNLFCLACPFMLVRNLARRFVEPSRLWPRPLRHKWLAVGLFAALLFAYEVFDLWATPRWTAWLIVGYFGGALAVDSLFRGASFCKYLCPLGQFNFLSSTLSPLEVRIRRPEPCVTCPTKPCITGRPVAAADREIASPPEGRAARNDNLVGEEFATAPSSDGPPGDGTPHCQLWLFQPKKVGNLDCTFCLDCLHACPYDNVGILTRVPAEELARDPQRSSLGRISRRPDLAALAVVFTFGALLNAFAMVSPVYALEDWLAGLLQTGSEWLVLALIFAGGLVVAPALLLGLAGWLSWPPRRPDGGRPALLSWITRFSYALLPLGFGVWLAHYSFHLLTGFWTVVPVLQSFVADVAGVPLLGGARWDLAAVLPASWLYPLELGFLGLGWFGSLLVAYRIAEREVPGRLWRAFAPWAVLLSLLFAAGIWLMGQPMEMRGTFLVG